MASDNPRGGSRSLPLIGRLLGGPMASALRRMRSRPSGEEEIQAVLREGFRAGIFGEAEHEIVKRVLRLGDHRANALMTPMKEIAWLDVADPPEEMKRKITESPHSRFPVCEGSIDNILGIVQVKDLLVHGFAGRPFGIKGLLKLPLLIYEGTTGLRALEMFKGSAMHFAVVLDEYGSVRGLLTLNDILEAIVGDLPTGDDPAEEGAHPAEARRRGGGTGDGVRSDSALGRRASHLGGPAANPYNASGSRRPGAGLGGRDRNITPTRRPP